MGAPEDLMAPEQVPPRILANTAVPTLVDVFPSSGSGDDPLFSVEFTSEDLGETVDGHLYLNLDREGVRRVGTTQEGAGSQADGARQMNIEWQGERESLAPGCYTLTMIIAHSSNFTTEFLPLPVDRDAAAYITWWIAHELPLQDLTFDQCPKPSLR